MQKQKSVPPKVPDDYCVEDEAFGRPDVLERTWRFPPRSNDPIVFIDFGRAVVQHAVSISLRRYKNNEGFVRTELTRRDGRAKSLDHWREVLNGHKWMSTTDEAIIHWHFPEAWPHPTFVRRLLYVASGGLFVDVWGTDPVDGSRWKEVDASTAAPRHGK